MHLPDFHTDTENMFQFLHGSTVLLITELNWVGVETKTQGVLKSILLIVSITSILKTLFKKDGKEGSN